jgi:hypothetical protein
LLCETRTQSLFVVCPTMKLEHLIKFVFLSAD